MCVDCVPAHVHMHVCAYVCIKNESPYISEGVGGMGGVGEGGNEVNTTHM